MSHNKVVQLLDKNITAHTVIEDLSPFVTNVEFLETGAEKTNTIKIDLKIDKAKKFILNAPVLVGDHTQPHNAQPKDKYLIYGYILQDGVKSTEFRGYITATEQTLNDSSGNSLTIYVTTQDYRNKQTLVSRNMRFFTPKNALSLRLTDANLEWLPSLKNAAISILKNTFPSDERLKQNWLLGTPRKLHDVLISMIKRLANPDVTGGSFKDYYIRIDPDTAGVGNTKNLLLTAEEFGESDSGVKIDPTSFTLLENKKIITDNTRYFNHVIVKAGKLGTLPQGYMRNTSNYEHARRRPIWNPLTDYLKDALVKKDSRYFKATQDIPSNAFNFEPKDTTVWNEDYILDTSYLEWNDIEAWRAGLTGFVVPKVGYEGGVIDFNVFRRNEDRQEDEDNPDDFETITLKDVEHVQNDVPTVKFDGMRVLINSFGGTGGFAGKKNQIAEWNNADNEWKFSKVAIDNDMVYDRNAGAILQYDLGTDTWDYPTDFFGDKLGFVTHVVKSITKTENAYGIPNAAIRFRYDWNVGENSVNRFSRGFWLNWWAPFPRRPTINGDIGHLYKNTVIDTDNLTYDSKGGLGWNNGTQSMDLGKIHSLFMSLRVSFEDSNDNLIDFIPEVKVGIAFIDKFLHVHMQEDVLRRNGAYDVLNWPVGKNAPTNLYHNRLDEVVKIFGISIPFFDFELKEREFSGDTFDWNHVVGWIIYWPESYDDNGSYSGARDQFVDDTRMILEQAWENLIHSVLRITGLPRANTIVHHVNIDLGDWYFYKDMYATSSDVKLDEPITKLVRAEEESDFNNATIRAEGEVSRSTFFPQMWYMEAKGNVKLRRGQKFKAVGPEVQGGEMELVCHEVKHISDGNSYHVQVTGVRKFEPAL